MRLKLDFANVVRIMSSFRWRIVFFLACASATVLKSESYAGSTSVVVDPAKVKQISWKPRAFVYRGFLTDLECDHLISLARSELKRSTVVDNEDTSKSTLSEVRTSSGMFIPKSKDRIVEGIENKIAAWTFLPVENGEDLQVLRYEYGQKYDPHHDFFDDEINLSRGGNRVATVLLYLSNVSKGGETVFPNAEIPERRRVLIDEELSECGRQGVAVKPRKGDALLFFSLNPNAGSDVYSLHGGCPVIEGEKWSATKWIHQRSFEEAGQNVEGCKDLNESCTHWASLGECTRNPAYMVGSGPQLGFCRKSCNACSG